MIAKDHVVEIAVDVGLHRPARIAVELVERRGQIVAVRCHTCVDGGDSQDAGDDVDVEAEVAIDVIDPAVAEDRVVDPNRRQDDRRPGCR